MPSYLIQASYTGEGIKGLMKDKASGRQKAVSDAVAGIGGKVEAFYFSFGKYDVAVVVQVPDNVSAAALALSVGASGLVHTLTTPLLSVEEADAALAKAVNYRGPGK